MPRVNLDDATRLRALDTRKMLDLTAAYPAHFRAGSALALRFDPPAPRAEIRNVVIHGTGGGSAASGQLLRSYAFRASRVPIHVVQGYQAPGYVGPQTLAIAASHSGQTEEVLSSFAQALDAGATALAMGAGGSLRRLAAESGAGYLEIPGGMMPRVAIGYLFAPMLVLLHRYGLIPDPAAELDEATALMEGLAPRLGPDSPLADNPAKRAAAALAGRIPVIYGFSDHVDAVAWRMKNQLGENSKYMGFWNTIPHLHHDEAVGWDMQPELLRRFAFVLMRDPEGESEKMRRRWTATREILQQRAGAVVELHAEGRGLLARMLSLVITADFATIYLALEKGVDPTPVSIIDLFKAKVGQ